MCTQVTRHNFDEALQSIKNAINECDFVAFDCEMTGLFLDNNEASYLDDMPLRYYKVHLPLHQLYHLFVVPRMMKAQR